MVRLKLRSMLITVIVLIVVTTILIGFYVNASEELFQNFKLKPPDEIVNNDSCEVIQVGIMCVTHSSTINLYTMLKSLLLFRNSPIHLHIVVDPQSKQSLTKLFETWTLPQVNVTFYNLKDVDPNNDFADSPNVLRMVLPRLIKFETISKIILLSTDIVFNADIYELWSQFQFFKKNQVLGLPLENQKEQDDRNNVDIVLYHLNNLRSYGWEKIWSMVQDRHVFEYNEFAQLQLIVGFFKISDLDRTLPSDWNSRSTNYSMKYKVLYQDLQGEIPEALVSSFMSLDGNTVRKSNYNCELQPPKKEPKKATTDKCSNFPESKIQKRRTISYFYKYLYVPSESDVTLVSQLSFDKMDLVEEFALRWNGPMSISFYLRDDEFIKCKEYIENSLILQNRFNIGYHAVFKVGSHYHINYLRNVALSEVNTPYVFSNDIDLLPMENLYQVLKLYLSNIPDMTKKALVVPAFETKRLEFQVPSTIKELLEMLKQEKVFIVQQDTRPEGHAPTNYTKWKTAEKPYKVVWKNKYEPYVVVKRDVVKYDERFFAYGWDKISHIMEITAQGYEFFVLPNTFIVHKFHEKSRDKKAFLKSKKYKRCLQSLKEQSAMDLKEKYGQTFLID